MEPRKDTIIYSSGAMVLAATVGATAEAQIRIAADADFELTMITAHIMQASLIVTNWAGTIQIHDSGVARNLIDGVCPLAALAGTAGNPYYLPLTRIVQRNAGLTVTLTNSVATATTVYVVFHGNRLTR